MKGYRSGLAVKGALCSLVLTLTLFGAAAGASAQISAACDVTSDKTTLKFLDLQAVLNAAADKNGDGHIRVCLRSGAQVYSYSSSEPPIQITKNNLILSSVSDSSQFNLIRSHAKPSAGNAVSILSVSARGFTLLNAAIHNSVEGMSAIVLREDSELKLARKIVFNLRKNGAVGMESLRYSGASIGTISNVQCSVIPGANKAECLSLRHITELGSIRSVTGSHPESAANNGSVLLNLSTIKNGGSIQNITVSGRMSALIVNESKIALITDIFAPHNLSKAVVHIYSSEVGSIDTVYSAGNFSRAIEINDSTVGAIRHVDFNSPLGDRAFVIDGSTIGAIEYYWCNACQSNPLMMYGPSQVQLVKNVKLNILSNNENHKALVVGEGVSLFLLSDAELIAPMKNHIYGEERIKHQLNVVKR
jgi:hypothetical protein